VLDTFDFENLVEIVVAVLAEHQEVAGDAVCEVPVADVVNMDDGKGGDGAALAPPPSLGDHLLPEYLPLRRVDVPIIPLISGHIVFLCTRC
jgi:hypothetical protein